MGARGSNASTAAAAAVGDDAGVTFTFDIWFTSCVTSLAFFLSASGLTFDLSHSSVVLRVACCDWRFFKTLFTPEAAPSSLSCVECASRDAAVERSSPVTSVTSSISMLTSVTCDEATDSPQKSTLAAAPRTSSVIELFGPEKNQPIFF